MRTTTQKIPLGYKQTEIGVIPVDWDVKSLGDVGEVKMCRRVFNHETKVADAIPFYKIGTFGKEADAYISQDLYDNYRHRFSFPKKGDILISAAGTIGRTIVYDGRSAYFQDSNIVWIDNNEELIFNDYLYYVFQIVKYNTEGGTIQRLYNSIIKSTKFICPTKPQQTAIATTLSDTDTLIEHLGKLIAKKKAIKQGAMQQLLTGKKRLPGFDEKWEIKKLGEVIHLQGGYAFKSWQFRKVGIPIIRISDVENNRINIDNSVCYEPFNIAKEFIAVSGDVLIAMSGATTGKIGVYGMNNIAYINQRVGKFNVSNIKKTSQEFISHVVRSEQFTEGLTKEIAQGAQPNISGKQIESIDVTISPTKEEQQAIATILSDMDSKIESLEKKRDKYMLIKQGMMQQLLSGKIRLLSN